MQPMQLQQHVQRQAAQFCERVEQALAPLEESSRRDVSDAAMTESLLYVSSAIDIATGPFPEVNLLDLIVFLHLCRDALEHYWIPAVYGERGQDVLAAFSKSESDVWEVAAMLIDATQRAELENIIDGWRAENPEQVRVEGVRLDDFARHAGQLALERAERTRGLLSSVKSASQAADQALLLAERAMFLANRLPFLVRLQARLACREIVSDAIARLVSVPAALWAGVRRALTGLTDRHGRPALHQRAT